MQPPPRPWAAALAALLALAGCATQAPPAPPEPPSAEALQARHAEDLRACEAYAQQAGVVQETLDGMVEGALVAAALVWGLGYGNDTVQGWATAGAVLGGAQSAGRALERRRRVVAHCMASRGHAARTALSAPAAPAAPPPAFQPQRPTGVDGFSAEQLARAASCAAVPVATLSAKGPGFETYTVPCDNAEALAIRCEFGNCRVLR